MAANQQLSTLDLNQALQRCIESDSDTLRTILHSEVSVIALTSANTGVGTEVIVPISAQGHSRVNIYAKSTTAVAAPPTLTIQLSPADSGDVWVSTITTLALSASINVVVLGAPNTTIVARRARVIISAALGVGETATAYLVLGSA